MASITNRCPVENLSCIFNFQFYTKTDVILMKQFSDHQLCFIFLHINHTTPTPKLVKITEQSEKAFMKLNNEMITSDIYNQLDKNPFANSNKNCCFIKPYWFAQNMSCFTVFILLLVIFQCVCLTSYKGCVYLFLCEYCKH